ncbi:MAG: RimK family protein [Paraglaciecola sp.]|uniref:RimK family protein n=1 Tax=Flavobacterium sp. W21_SRS_FM6 TaxID=3240268 RepID=UPI00276E56B8|nr:RimK family protein [Paraglaciecola sp.]
MFKTLVVVDHPLNLPDSELTIVNFEQYLAEYPKAGEPKIRIINLCDTEKYLSQGYYCSLLAEARQHKVLPSVNTINDLSLMPPKDQEWVEIPLSKSQIPAVISADEKEFLVFFGWTKNESLRKLAKFAFEKFPAPILKLSVARDAHQTQLICSAIGVNEIAPELWDQFTASLEHFTLKVWRNPPGRKRARWDMGILVNPDEKTPPSDAKAIQLFIKAANKVGINAEVFTAAQSAQLYQYDALFIRETTSIKHHTYELARKGEKEGMVVMDDPTSILRCCNKVFLHDAFSYHNISAPKTHFVSKSDPATIDRLETEFSYPIVLKLPESSFSLGVFKAKDRSELTSKLEMMLKQSALVLIQEYLYTEYDWRIGVLNGRAIYACRYFMARNHWQIYNHGSKRNNAGNFETIPTFEVPRAVLATAIKSCEIVGNGLYGVDLKQVNDKVYVIEVNDNPNLDSKIEDKYLGDELYRVIMQEFADRLEYRGR